FALVPPAAFASKRHSPQMRPRFESWPSGRHRFTYFLAKDIAGKPLIRFAVGPPRVKMHVKLVFEMLYGEFYFRSISSIHLYYCKILILHPDSSQKSRALGLRRPLHIKNKATYFTQEFSPYVRKSVVVLVESAPI